MQYTIKVITIIPGLYLSKVFQGARLVESFLRYSKKDATYAARYHIKWHLPN